MMKMKMVMILIIQTHQWKYDILRMMNLLGVYFVECKYYLRTLNKMQIFIISQLRTFSLFLCTS
ncbi:unnamed protein product [Schistosoma curassoni]|uniref:Ovule protein n=1 Tax=Schistosoma curassoni TaxID=6186 RepID=A0A183JSP3_9TREM|nr:unnamed protein product [Schistosoma curassoni]